MGATPPTAKKPGRGKATATVQLVLSNTHAGSDPIKVHVSHFGSYGQRTHAPRPSNHVSAFVLISWRDSTAMRQCDCAALCLIRPSWISHQNTKNNLAQALWQPLPHTPTTSTSPVASESLRLGIGQNAKQCPKKVKAITCDSLSLPSSTTIRAS